MFLGGGAGGVGGGGGGGGLGGGWVGGKVAVGVSVGVSVGVRVGVSVGVGVMGHTRFPSDSVAVEGRVCVLAPRSLEFPPPKFPEVAAPPSHRSFPDTSAP